MIETPGFIPYMSGKSNLKNLALIRNQIGNYEIEEALRSVGLDPNFKETCIKVFTWYASASWNCTGDHGETTAVDLWMSHLMGWMYKGLKISENC